jgi:hypothetical protein
MKWSVKLWLSLAGTSLQGKMEGLLGVLNSQREHFSSTVRGEVSPQHHITIHCRRNVWDDN